MLARYPARARRFLVARLPAPVYERLRSARDTIRYLLRPSVAGARDWWTIRALTGDPGDAIGDPVPVRLRPLDNAVFWIRPGTTDASVVWNSLVGLYHLPPAEARADAASAVLDLGANIGVTMAHLAVRFPKARIVGVELHPATAELARRNLRPWGERVEVVTGAAWTESGRVRFRHAAGDEHGSRVVDDDAPEVLSTEGYSVLDLVKRAGGAVEYMKVDIEGAESRILTHNTGWAAAVRVIKVEVHDPYTVDQCLEDLAALGYRAWRDPGHWACAVGVRS